MRPREQIKKKTAYAGSLLCTEATLSSTVVTIAPLHIGRQPITVEMAEQSVSNRMLFSQSCLTPESAGAW